MSELEVSQPLKMDTSLVQDARIDELYTSSVQEE